jgi:hypothetical protein
MKLRSYRRGLVVFSSSGDPADRYTPPFGRTTRRSRARRLLHTGGLLTLIGMIGVVRVARSRRRLLAALILTSLTVILRNSLWGVASLLVLVLYVSALVSPTT